MKTKVALIGGSGFVGSRLIQESGTEGFYIVDKNQSPFYPMITRIRNICDNDFAEVLDKATTKVVLLAAEHRDDVSPTSLYYDVNVEGTKNVLFAMDQLGINHLVFTSSVAIYGLNKDNPDENHPSDPFNHYGKSKWMAEEVLREWYNRDPEVRTLTILRPTVIFGERNRGNVYNLLRQVASGKFLLTGKGKNKKSMAYVGNIAAFINYCLSIQNPGYQVFNYIDKPDLDMNELISLVREKLGKSKHTLRIPYFVGMSGGYFFDLLAKVTGKSFSISSVRVKKFCATTQFNAGKAHSSGFHAPYSLQEGLEKTLHFEFVSKQKDTITFVSE
jgi:nucleoside-diphosphate-sugar epimerase